MESSAEAHTKPAESDVANDELKRLVHILYGNDLPPVLMGPIYKQHGVTNSLPALSDLPLKDSVEKGSKITSDGNVMVIIIHFRLSLIIHTLMSFFFRLILPRAWVMKGLGSLHRRSWARKISLRDWRLQGRICCRLSPGRLTCEKLLIQLSTIEICQRMKLAHPMKR